jgi:hypothetical protein
MAAPAFEENSTFGDALAAGKPLRAATFQGGLIV